jgi:hypothetical protein
LPWAGARPLVHGPRSRDGVELIGVIEDGRFGRPSRAQVVMHGHGVEQFRTDIRLERSSAPLDEP